MQESQRGAENTLIQDLPHMLRTSAVARIRGVAAGLSDLVEIIEPLR